jgi:hypothetical protein
LPCLSLSGSELASERSVEVEWIEACEVLLQPAIYVWRAKNLDSADAGELFFFLKSRLHLMSCAVALGVKTIEAEVIEGGIAVAGEHLLGD